ncbi:MAG: FAD-binding oxidoreductase [Elainellaceae cyanobacterium]
MFDYAVIGKGLIGASAARSLASVSPNIAVIGPDEPSSLATHDGIFASHYDQGRITRVLDENLVWATLAQRSLDTYGEIEQESGVRFHYPAGAMRVGHNTPAHEAYIANNRQIGTQLGATFQAYDTLTLQDKFPYFQFSSQAIALHETGGAGFINPRALIQAQLTIAESKGAAIFRSIVKDLRVEADHCCIDTHDGQIYEARKVLITTGAFTNFFSLVGRSLAWKVVAESILLAELSDDSLDRIRTMPSLMYRVPVDGNPENPSYWPAYLVPPTGYPDGRTYLKIGIGNQRDRVFTSLHEINHWFRSGPSAATHDHLLSVLKHILPDIEVLATQAHPCALTFTATNHPYIDVVAPQKIFMAVGGCGYAGKSAVEIGRLGAQLAIHDRWTEAIAPTLKPDVFRAVYAD